MASITRFCLFSWRAFFVALLALAVFSQSDTAARLYGGVDPVVSVLQVERVDAVTVRGMPGSQIHGTAELLRPECDYISLEWTLEGANRSVRAPAFFADPAQVRQGGQTRWDALLVGVPPNKLASTKGDVRHECGVFPVTSPFYRPDTEAAPAPVVAGATALCHDGTYSTSQTRQGTCSHHGGVETWLAE